MFTITGGNRAGSESRDETVNSPVLSRGGWYMLMGRVVHASFSSVSVRGCAGAELNAWVLGRSWSHSAPYAPFGGLSAPLDFIVLVLVLYLFHSCLGLLPSGPAALLSRSLRPLWLEETLEPRVSSS